jgi:hypothetical protein
MTNLDAAADKAVHDAVDAFMDGSLRPDFTGETVFETKHSRYRLRNGVVYAAPSDGLIGAELVGWLMETSRRTIVESAWQPGSRAVLVDRARGRNIIVTSSTRLLHLEDTPLPVRAPTPGHAGHANVFEPDREPSASPYADPYADPRPYAAREGRVIPATPFPPAASSGPPLVFPQSLPIPQARPMAQVLPSPQARPLPPPPQWSPAMPAPLAIPPAPVPAPLPPPAAGARRGGALHLPPRPIHGRGAVTPTPPREPPRQVIPTAQVPQFVAPIVAETPWELTSSEIELEDPLESEETLPGRSLREVPEAPESGGGAPIPLVKPR